MPRGPKDGRAKDGRAKGGHTVSVFFWVHSGGIFVMSPL